MIFLIDSIIFYKKIKTNSKKKYKYEYKSVNKTLLRSEH